MNIQGEFILLKVAEPITLVTQPKPRQSYRETTQSQVAKPDTYGKHS